VKGTAAIIGVLCLSPVFLAGTAVLAAAGAGGGIQAQNIATDDCVDAEAVAQQVAAVLNGSNSDDAPSVEELTLPSEQIPHARTIITTGISLQVPERGRVVALATAMQESRLRNLRYGDRDSLGLFQQRPSQGWGTAEQILDPVHASTSFYRALLDTPGWQSMTITQAAQAVQRSAYPDAYAQWEPLARALQQAIADTLPHTPGTQDANDGADETATGCEPQPGGSDSVPAPDDAAPAGYAIPDGTPPQIRTAITWAMRQLGTPYQWGGNCTDPHGPDPLGRCDCSSLMQQAYAAAGITLSRTTYTQVNEGEPVQTDGELRPGDLLFVRGTATAPEHVGMYLGAGLVINAPRSDRNIRIERIADWRLLAVRRII
jgi:cell wall-associated NlpC family hydrolase